MPWVDDFAHIPELTADDTAVELGGRATARSRTNAAGAAARILKAARGTIAPRVADRARVAVGVVAAVVNGNARQAAIAPHRSERKCAPRLSRTVNALAGHAHESEGAVVVGLAVAGIAAFDEREPAVGARHRRPAAIADDGLAAKAAHAGVSVCATGQRLVTGIGAPIVRCSRWSPGRSRSASNAAAAENLLLGDATRWP